MFGIETFSEIFLPTMCAAHVKERTADLIIGKMALYALIGCFYVAYLNKNSGDLIGLRITDLRYEWSTPP